MSAFDEYFAHYEGGRPQHPLYQASIRTMYDCLDQEIPVTPAQVVNIVEYTNVHTRKHAYSFLARECGLALAEVHDRFITPRGERSAFLGFRVLDHERERWSPMLLEADDLGKDGKARLQASIEAHRAAGAGTIREALPGFIDQSSWRFIPKADIWLNREQRDDLERIWNMREEIDERIQESIRIIESVTTSLLQRLFRQGKVAEFLRIRQELHEICREHTDACVQSDALVFGEAMGKPIDHTRDLAIGSSIIIQRTLLRRAENKLTR